MSQTFQKALESGNTGEIRRIPKSDLHNHCLMGGRIGDIEKFCGRRLERFKSDTGTIHDLNRWIARVYRPLFLQHPGAFTMAVEAAFVQAKRDGVKHLEMSIDIGYGPAFGIEPGVIVATLQNLHRTVAPEIDYRPELGFIRGQSMRKLLANLEPYLDFGYFKSIDLYDDEFAQPIRNFREIFRFARKMGLKCKAHAGEFGDADSVREAVEELELDVVQHGISAATSPEVMQWLARNNIQLNVCPASNIRLKRVRSYKTHPVRILFDHGIRVTINTDDVVAFGAGVSEQFKRLYTSGLFTAGELDLIRNSGLSG
ncbi:MAG: adenosine deaminase [bacterium]